MSYGRLAYTDKGRAFQADINPESGGPTHLDPWGSQAEEMVFGIGHGGHDGGSIGVLLPPQIELAPFTDAMEFVVARTGSSLNVRAASSPEAEILTSLPDGSRAELARATDRGEGDPSIAHDAGGVHLWVYTRAGDGTEGWVDRAFLD